MNQNKWKGILVVLAYSFTLPTTFLRWGYFKIKPIFISLFFLVGKFTSSYALHLGNLHPKTNNIDNIFRGSLLLVCFGICDAILFVFFY
jgi:hypothetical protein